MPRERGSTSDRADQRRKRFRTHHDHHNGLCVAPGGVCARVASIEDVEEVEAAFASMLRISALAAVFTALAKLTLLSMLSVAVA